MKKTIVGALLLASMLSAAPASAAESETKLELDYAPLVPQIEWEKLNGLQKTTAAIAIVPGCILSALYNTFVWVAK